MSLLVPRSLFMLYLKFYNSEQARRHEVKPGITGWAQVNGRNTISWEGKFRLEVEYFKKNLICFRYENMWMRFLKGIQKRD
jgi:lipopolysaccharide/colanic/teichoic acid biosynthesis glycosyltransferase